MMSLFTCSTEKYAGGRWLAQTLVVLAGALVVLATCFLGPSEQDSGGRLLPEQAAYDVTFYDLDVQIFPKKQALAGTLTTHARVVKPLEQFVLQLDDHLAVDSAAQVGPHGERTALPVERRNVHQIWMMLPEAKQAGDSVVVEVAYSGSPQEAANPPWDGGFTWSSTPGGQPWIGTSCQTEGADLWWPVKDHPSDEPDSMAIRVTVPEPLKVASNGRLRSVKQRDSLRAYHWFVSTPINTYGVALNIAPYDTVQARYKSVANTTLPVTFWALPEYVDEARAALPEFLKHVRFLEETLGPYPFRADKYGIAQAPFLGMEHQTIIAYGNVFGRTGVFGYDQGFDALHFHELAHEWFGNLVTNRDWKDFWIHEGFASYLEALYAEHLNDEAGYRAVLDVMRRRIQNQQPIARHRPTTAETIYSNNDIYYKGAWTLHTLRYLIGDQAFFRALRRMAYPKPALEEITDGRQTRLVDTGDFIRIAEEEAGRELDWFFDVYVYQAQLPRLVQEETADGVRLRWEAPGERSFPMPVNVRVDGATRRIAMENGTATIPVEEANVVVDPKNRVLKR